MATLLASGLPSDILRLIFDLLDQPDVIACAAVCCEWRAAAVLSRSYYRALTLLFPTAEHDPPVTNQDQTPDNSLDTLRSASRDARQFEYGISLTIEVRVDFEALSANTSDDTHTIALQMYETGSLQIEQELVPALRSAIPYLVRLDVQVEHDFVRQLLPALAVPAPLLRFFKMQFWAVLNRWDYPLPCDLFSGHAPLLTEVNLASMQLCGPTPCFRNARRLQLDTEYTSGHDLAVMISCFPRVRHLVLCSLRRSPEDPVSAEKTAFFGRLRSLCIGRRVDSSALAPFLPAIAHIPDVELCTGRDVDALAEVLGFPAPDEIVLSEHVAQGGQSDNDFSHLRARLSAPAATRVLNSRIEYDATLRALRLSAAPLSLTRLTVDDRHCRSLIQACPSMPLLERLSVVLLAWSATSPGEIDCACPVVPFFTLDTRPPDGTLAVDYPRLRTLELRATHAHASVRADVLPALARCLGHRLHVVLSNGLSCTPGPGGTHTAFRSIFQPAEDFVPSADTARVAVLLETAARHPDRMHSSRCPHFRRTEDFYEAR